MFLGPDRLGLVFVGIFSTSMLPEKLAFQIFQMPPKKLENINIIDSLVVIESW